MWAPAAEGVALDVLVEQLGRVQLWCVAGQELQLNLLSVHLDPLFHLLGAVHGMPVEDQDDLLPLALADETVQEVDEHAGDEFVLEHPEGQVSLVGDRRDHVRAEPLSGAFDHRGLPDRAPRPSGGVIRAQTHLIRPQDQRLFAMSTLFDRRIALIKPPRNDLGVLLERPSRGLLRAESPRAQIPSRGLLRDTDTEPPVDQLAHQPPGPQKPRQLELVRVLLADRPRDLRLLGRCERRLLAQPPPPLARRERPVPTKALSAHPLTHRLARNVKQPRDLGLGATLAYQRDSTPAKLLLSRLPQPPRIPSPHTPKPTSSVGRLLGRSSISRMELRSAQCGAPGS